MHRSRLVTGLAGAFALMTVVLAVGGLAGSLILLPVAALFAAMTYVLWSHATGRLMGRLYRSVENQARTAGAAGGGRQRARRERQRGGSDRGGFGAGPREEWTAPREGRSVTEEARRRARQQARARQGRAADRGRGQRRQRRASRPGETSGPTAREAYETLGVEPGADESAVKRAYRERIKDVHPDAADGDAEEFKRVQAAYDRLTE
ncbi:J domain-containing protein [Salinirussus salinus]|uniref:J domain-containing protein n=1 Tax=Salinirussus salinus TaxID=1198300 RepID=UPI001358BEEC|nr:J domain-containing protein [Salinirussus salinus]